VVAALLVPALARAQESASWIGKRVVTKPEAQLRIGDRVVDDGGMFRVYKVEQVNGDWLWLVSLGASGWVPSGQVIGFDEAIVFYTDEIRRNPSQASAFARRGLVWAEKGEINIAIDDYSQAIRLDPNLTWAYCNRGLVWTMKKEYDKAIADYSEAIRRDPKFAPAFVFRGGVWRDKREFEKAIADQNEAIRLNPRYAEAFAARGYTSFLMNNYDQAIDDLNEAIHIDPASWLAFNRRGMLWMARSDPEKAIDDFSEAIRLNPESALARANRGKAWRMMRQYEKSLADLDEAVRLDPRSDLSLNGRAWLRATCPDPKYRDGKLAIDDATRACELSGFKDGSSLGTLAAAYAEAGDFTKAVEWQQKVNRLLTDAEEKNLGAERLRLYKAKHPYRDDHARGLPQEAPTGRP
jgi:tetratricopeptide (TPR) repeat protein